MKRLAVFLFVLTASAGLLTATDMVVEVKVGTAISDRNPVDPGVVFSANTVQLIGSDRSAASTL